MLRHDTEWSWKTRNEATLENTIFKSIPSRAAKNDGEPIFSISKTSLFRINDESGYLAYILNPSKSLNAKSAICAELRNVTKKDTIDDDLMGDGGGG